MVQPPALRDAQHPAPGSHVFLVLLPPAPLTPPNAKSKSVFLLLASLRILFSLVSFGEEWLCVDNNNFHFPIQGLLFYLWVTD